MIEAGRMFSTFRALVIALAEPFQPFRQFSATTLKAGLSCVQARDQYRSVFRRLVITPSAGPVQRSKTRSFKRCPLLMPRRNGPLL